MPPIVGFWVRSGAGKGNPRRGRLVYVRFRRKARLRHTRLMIEVERGGRLCLRWTNLRSIKGSQTPSLSLERGLVHLLYFSLLEG